jgi:hypothetical protein
MKMLCFLENSVIFLKKCQKVVRKAIVRWNFLLLELNMWGLLRKVSAPGMFCALYQWSSAPVAYSPIRTKSQIFNKGHDYALWIKNFMVMMKNSRTSIWDLVQLPTVIIWLKSRNSNIRHFASLSIGKFHADDK